MKLSFSTLGCPEWSFAQILKNARNYGYSAIELRGVQGEMRADRLACLKPENEAETKSLLEEYGLKICGFGSSADFHDPARFEASVDEVKAAVPVCQRMGIPNIRVFGNSFSKDNMNEATDRVIAGIDALCEFSKDTGVNIILEVHGDFNTSESLAPVIAALKNHGNFGILWDIANSDIVYGDRFPEFYSVIRPYIRHVHVKDHFRANGQLCRLGEGDVPIGGIVKTLLDGGYDGYFSLEWEKKWHPELAEPEVAFPEYIEFMNALE